MINLETMFDSYDGKFLSAIKDWIQSMGLGSPVTFGSKH